MYQRPSVYLRLDSLFLALILFVSYAYFFPRWADPNQNSRLDMVVAVVEDGTFAIDPYVANTVDYARVGEHYYSDKPPGTAFLGIPVYAALKSVLDTPIVNRLVERLAASEAFQATLREGGSGVYAAKVRFALAQVVLTLCISTLAAVTLGVLLYRVLLSMKIKRGFSLGAVLGVGLLSPMFAYGNAFYGHVLSAALLLGAFFLIRGEHPERLRNLLGTGFLLGYAVITEYPVILIAGVLAVYLGWRLVQRRVWPRLIWAALPALLIGGGLMAYNQAVFGGPFRLGYGYSELWETQHQTGFMSLTMPHPEALWGITFSPFRGLFFFSPLLLLSLPGFVSWWRSRQYRAEWWVSLASVGLMFLFNASSIMWWGGFAVGPRYILPAVPFLGLGLGFGLAAGWRHRWFRGVVMVLGLGSLAATWGLTLAGQAFPSDTLHNPLLEYAWPNWQAGNIARNVGTVLGWQGAASLLPWMGLLVVLGGIWWWQSRKVAPESSE
ncbi:MAG TPA: hypothetical protein DEQ80_06310 [Anaerolinea thermolimosa]|uniref:Glycosyltransferase RgtA/B/C/D-like domain-containing protein n=1 Tax=Anaerolinea thermolimosa TaxID=229919 RepID=A0A0M8JP50_9CHLR|nr:hypothetical protein [Anaerolinea thermolimosa]GAP08780.1 hypothetical protein ATHL_03689 [Anaerolinea thermolimosa]GAP08830.1 hypothetical protein ATHL_03740 [Anaerolinea thermolimosa]HCE17454.1 hypothetical protein [Anaerolinea thermolimosa]